MYKECAPIVMAGFVHGRGERHPIQNNYEACKGLLQRMSPGFVTLEIQPFIPQTYDWFEEVFSADTKHLSEIDQEFQQTPVWAGEFMAGAIYCLQTQTPLYFVDLNMDHPELYDPNLINLTADPESFEDRYRRSYGQDGNLSLGVRNDHMAEVIDMVAKNHPGETGVHIGGIAHNYPERTRSASELQWITPIQNSVRSRPTLVLDFSFLK